MKLDKKLESLKISIRTVRDELKARSGKSANRHEDLLQFDDAKLREFLVNKKIDDLIAAGDDSLNEWMEYDSNKEIHRRSNALDDA